jgi:hypothetical protein
MTLSQFSARRSAKAYLVLNHSIVKNILLRGSTGIRSLVTLEVTGRRRGRRRPQLQSSHDRITAE